MIRGIQRSAFHNQMALNRPYGPTYFNMVSSRSLRLLDTWEPAGLSQFARSDCGRNLTNRNNAGGVNPGTWGAIDFSSFRGLRPLTFD